ncbi:MAG: 30S ribosomal protein S6 [Candidatus Omnitrophica bacterium]|nr:30S ribosomal protein S6 [Candidatus Omnitrophota bacterium]
MIRKYEGMFIFPPDEAQTASKDEEKRLEETIRRLGGKVLERRDWGRRLLGYPLRKHREGRMLLWNFEMDSLQVKELKKVLQLDEKILRSTIVLAVEPKPVEETRAKVQPPKVVAREGREEIRARQPE